MPIRTVARALLAAAALFGTAATAAAQGSTQTDVAVGYQFTHLLGSGGNDGTNIPKGWTASLTGHVSPAVNLVGEVNGAYLDDNKRHNFLGGIRFGGSQSGATHEAVVFGQFLAGASRSSGASALVLQPGIGLDIRGRGPVAARVNFDYVLTRSNGETGKGVRVALNLVFDLHR